LQKGIIDEETERENQKNPSGRHHGQDQRRFPFHVNHPYDGFSMKIHTRSKGR